MKNNGRYEATSECPQVLCSYGESPSKAFRQMAKLMDEMDCAYISGAHTHFNEETFFLTVYV